MFTHHRVEVTFIQERIAARKIANPLGPRRTATPVRRQQVFVGVGRNGQRDDRAQILVIVYVKQKTIGELFVQVVEGALPRHDVVFVLLPCGELLAQKFESSLHFDEHPERQRHAESDALQLRGKF